MKDKPNILLVDNGKKFCNNIFIDYLNINNIEKRTTFVYNPKYNRIVERFNSILKELLIKDFTQKKNNFDIKTLLKKVYVLIIIKTIILLNSNLYIYLIVLKKKTG